MILRKRNINPKKTEVGLHVAWGTPDVKSYMRRYFSALSQPLGADWALSVPISEQDVLTWLMAVPFVEFEKPHIDQLARWALTQAIEQGYLIPSAGKENAFYFSAEVAKKIGRPRKDGEIQ